MKKKKLDILYEDKYIIVVNKINGMLTISDNKTFTNILYHEVSLYLKKQNKNNKVFIIHRLDKDTSGLIVFAKNLEVKKIMQDDWASVKREYYAVVEGIPKNKKGTLKSYLKSTRTNLVYSTKHDGKLAITNYEVIKTKHNYSLLKINIETGKKHQIRVQLSDMGNPILGDKIYGDKKIKGINRLYLHAYLLEFTHPINKNICHIETKYPLEFTKIIDIEKG